MASRFFSPCIYPMRSIVGITMTILLCLSFVSLQAQTVQGNILRGIVYAPTDNGVAPKPGVVVSLRNSATGMVQKIQSNRAGVFQFSMLPVGQFIITYSGIDIQSISKPLTVSQGTFILADTLTASTINFNEVTVFGASRRQQKVTEAPASVSVVSADDIKRGIAHGQTAKVLEGIVGVDVAQSGMNDFNVNMRGFNNSINRRVLVLIDGRDPSTPLLNLMEWNSLSASLSDIAQMDVVRGPGSALYGANAYNGVINMTTYSPRQVLGTRINATIGEFQTVRGDIRHAGEIGKFSYKLTLGASQQLNHTIVSRLRDTSQTNFGLEYPGLAFDVRPLNDVDRKPFWYTGTARIDYNFDDDHRLVAEGGYSYSGNEFYVNQTGRILIPIAQKPFVRLAYNSPEWNIQAHWNNRTTPVPQLVYNALATSAEQSDVVMIDAQYNKTLLDDRLRLILGASHEYQGVNTTLVGAVPLLAPDNIHHNYSGVYSQVEFALTPTLNIVGAARIDRSTFFDTQFSPKLGVVWEAVQDHTLRFTVNRSFLRPSYPDAGRRSPAGLPVNVASISQTVNQQVSALTGRPLQDIFGLSSLPQWNLGNPTIQPETAVSFEVGYKGIINNRWFITADVYYNRRSNFISTPLGGLAQNVFTPVRANTGDGTANRLADSLLRTALNRVNPLFYDRLALDMGFGGTARPALIIAPRNIGLINEYGLELAGNYFVNDHLSLQANYAYLATGVVENDVPTQRIQPNTSPHRITLGATYTIPNLFDINAQFRYVEAFPWVAGLFEGMVPSYAVMNLNARYTLNHYCSVQLNIFNLLDREHYQIFGGSILRRYSTLTVAVTL